MIALARRSVLQAFRGNTRAGMQWSGTHAVRSPQRNVFIRPSPIIQAANPQSGKPASDNLGHMVQNIKEESKSVKSSIESSVAGTSNSPDGQKNELVSDAVSSER